MALEAALAAWVHGVLDGANRFGMLYVQRGWREQAHAELSAAITMYQAMDMTLWLLQAEATLAQVEAR
jgi:hypothetical protein